MIIISILFFLSGFAALSYEVLWQRDLGLIFGNTVHSAATVTAAYMVGIALGAYFAGKWADKLKRPVLAFGFLELGIGLYALCVPFLFALLRLLYRFAYQNISESLPFLTVVRLVLGLIVLLVPTMLMGATLPVLCKGLADRKAKFAARVGVLYGMNTLGAVAGVLTCAFLMIPSIGLTATRFTAVGVSILVALLSIAISFAFPVSTPSLSSDRSDETDGADFAGNKTRIRLLLFAAAASGFLALAFEVVWFRTLILVFGSTTYSFSTMLAIFLLGISLGASLLGGLADKAKRPALLFGASATAIGIFSLFSLYWFCAMPEWLLNHLVSTGFTWYNMLFAKFAIAMFFLFFPAICFGLSFTAATKAIRLLVPSSSRTVGDVAAFNTVGASLGAIITGFIILPIFGMLNCLLILGTCSLILGSSLIFFSGKFVWSRILFVVIVATGAVLVFIFPPEWDKQLLTSGPYFSPWNFVRGKEIILRSRLDSERLLHYSEGTTSTASTTKSPDETLYFSIDGKVESDTLPRGQVIQRMIGHIPMLFHPNPKRVLNIGLGAGVTLGALGCYPVDHLEVVEIEPEAVRVAKVWGEYNHHVTDHEKLEITIGDGRNHLFCTEEKYDVITSDPFEPVVGGAANLFTVNHFRQARTCLADNGIMCQWVPMYELSQVDFLTIIRSFVHVFPESALFFTGRDIVMLGFPDELRLNAEIVKEKFAIPSVRDSLADVGFVSADMILGMFVSKMSEADKLVGSGPLNTDENPVVEFSAPKSALHYTSDANQQVLLDSITDVPVDFLAPFSPDQQKLMRAGHEALKMTLQASIFRGRDKFDESMRLLVKAAEMAPRNPVVRNEMVISLLSSANNLRISGDARAAWLQYQIALQYQPDEFWPLYHLVGMAMQNRNIKAAKKFLDAGVAAYPESPLFMALRGKFKGSTGDIDGALEDLRVAIGQLPRRADFWRDYAFFLEGAGKLEESKEAAAEAKRLKTSVF